MGLEIVLRNVKPDMACKGFYCNGDPKACRTSGSTEVSCKLADGNRMTSADPPCVHRRNSRIRGLLEESNAMEHGSFQQSGP